MVTASRSRPRHSRRRPLTGSSSASRPSSIARIASVAVATGLVSDARSKIVSSGMWLSYGSYVIAPKAWRQSGPVPVRLRHRRRGRRVPRRRVRAGWQRARTDSRPCHAAATSGISISTNDRIHADRLVTPAPRKAYHVQAQAPVAHAQATAPVPRSMPASIARDLTRVPRTPVRNAPSTGPAASESTDKPESSTDWSRTARRARRRSARCPRTWSRSSTPASASARRRPDGCTSCRSRSPSSPPAR